MQTERLVSVDLLHRLAMGQGLEGFLNAQQDLRKLLSIPLDPVERRNMIGTLLALSDQPITDPEVLARQRQLCAAIVDAGWRPPAVRMRPASTSTILGQGIPTLRSIVPT